MAQSPIQQKKQDNRMSIGDGVWRQQERGGWEKFETEG